MKNILVFVLTFFSTIGFSQKNLVDSLLLKSADIQSITRKINDKKKVALIGDILEKYKQIDNGIACEWNYILDDKVLENRGADGRPADLFDDKPPKKLVLLYLIDVLFWSDAGIYSKIRIDRYKCNPYADNFVIDSCLLRNLKYYFKHENAKNYPYQDCSKSSEINDYILNEKLFEELFCIYSNWYIRLQYEGYKSMLVRKECPLYGTRYRWLDHSINDWLIKKPLLPFYEIERGPDFRKNLEMKIKELEEEDKREDYYNCNHK